MVERKRHPLLIAITDRRLLHQPVESWVRAVIEGGVDIVQIREKDLDVSALHELSSRILNVVGDGTKVQINGFPALADELGVGIHLSEFDDRSLSAAAWPRSRAIHGVAAVSLSDVDFVVAGNVFPTASKRGLPGRGIAWLRDIVLSSPVPVVAVGGINRGNAAEAMRAGVLGVAVIRELIETDEPGLSARELRQVIDEARESAHER